MIKTEAKQMSNSKLIRSAISLHCLIVIRDGHRCKGLFNSLKIVCDELIARGLFTTEDYESLFK